MEVGEKEDDEDDAAAGSVAATAKTKGGNKKRNKTISSEIIRNIGDTKGMGKLSVGNVRDFWHASCPEDTMSDRHVLIGSTKPNPGWPWRLI